MEVYEINYDRDFDINECDDSDEYTCSEADDEYYNDDGASYGAPYVSHGHSGGDHTELPVTQVRFTHAVISRKFRTENRGDINAPPEGPRLEETFRQLVENPGDIQNIPRVPVMKHKGQYWAVNGNRRLFIYKSLHSVGLVERVPVRIIPFDAAWFEKAHSTKNDGKTVQVNGVNMADFEAELKGIYLRTRHGHLADITQRNQVKSRNRVAEKDDANTIDFRKCFEVAKKHKKESIAQPDHAVNSTSKRVNPQTETARPGSTVYQQKVTSRSPTKRSTVSDLTPQRLPEVARIQPRTIEPSRVLEPVRVDTTVSNKPQSNFDDIVIRIPRQMETIPATSRANDNDSSPKPTMNQEQENHHVQNVSRDTWRESQHKKYRDIERPAPTHPEKPKKPSGISGFFQKLRAWFQ